jgi:TonB-linked SusC/RagA family outer membrane protein
MCRFALAIGGLLVIAAALGPRTLGAQGSGTVTGRVTDRSSGSGVPTVQISVVGSAIKTVSNDSGFFRIRNVPAGTQSIRAIRLGYSANAATVTVTDGGTVNVDIALTAASITLTTVQVTGTLQAKESREVTTLQPTLTPDSLVLAATPNFASLLEGNAPGVQVTQSSGTVGTGARVRIRGSSSVSLSNEPLLVIDGVEVANDANSFGLNALGVAVGGQEPSRLNDINPDDIESVQTLQGPAATGLYGTAAANGVIVITTKRGQAGRQHWDGFVENGQLTDLNKYPSNFESYAHIGTGPSHLTHCTIWLAKEGACTIDSIASYNPIRGVLSPLRLGREQEYNLSTSGGSDINQYFLSGDYRNETGTDKVNALIKTNGRGNFTTRPRQDLSLSVSTGYVSSNTRLPQNDNDILGVLSEGLLGGVNPKANGGFFTGTLNPAVTANIRTFQDIQRFTPSLQANYQPLSWLTANATTGFDLVNQDDQDGEAPNLVPFANLITGTRTRNRLETETYTVNVNTSATAHLPADIRSTTTVGGSWRRVLSTGTFGTGAGLTTGANSLTAVSSLFAVSEQNIDNRTIGGFLSQQFAWRDKLYLTAGARIDKNSSTGVSSGTTTYPTGSIAYVLSDEPWFPKSEFVSALKLRAAVGQSGLRPEFLDAIQFRTPTQAILPSGAEVAAFAVGNPGNAFLKPERTTEVETGFDLSLLRDRVTVGLTYYDKHTQDALIQQVLQPSVGDTNFRWINIGKVRNRGLELQTTTELIKMRNANFTVTGNFSTLENRLQQLGAGIAPIIFGLGGATQEHAQGFPLGGYWQQKYTFKDVNHDGVIEPNEITVSPTRSYLGSSLPTTNASLSPQLTLFRVLRVSSLFDFQGGNKLYNSTADFRCGQFRNCIEDYAATSLSRQARAEADFYDGTVAGYIEDASFWKWREAAISLLVPQEWARRIAARGITLTFAARNLRTWTKYTGIDPEVSQSAQTNFTLADFLTQPPVRYYTFRATINY